MANLDGRRLISEKGGFDLSLILAYMAVNCKTTNQTIAAINARFIAGFVMYGLSLLERVQQDSRGIGLAENKNGRMCGRFHGIPSWRI